MKNSIINVKTLILSTAAALFLSGCNSSSESPGNTPLDQDNKGAVSTSQGIDKQNPLALSLQNAFCKKHPYKKECQREPDLVIQTKEWNIQIIAEDTTAGLKNSGSYLGQLTAAEDQADKYDLKVLSGGFSSKFLSVIFSIDGKGAGYNTDYHKLSEATSDSWDFTVKTNDPDSTITLSWKGIYAVFPTTNDTGRVTYERELRDNDALLSRMQLLDIDTNVTVPVYAVGKIQSYTFSMNGETERTFRWELLEEDSVASIQDATDKRFLKASAKIIKEDIPWIDTMDTIDPTKPPTMGNN